jgi:hypothetical protein
MSGISPAQRVRIGGAAIVLFILASLCTLALPVLAAGPWWITASLAAIALVLALPFFLIRFFFKKGQDGWSAPRSYLGTATILFMAITSAAAFPIYYFAYLVDARPTTMPLVTLSDGKKTVQFQGMQHIGSENFYKSVVYDLREALDNGYRLFYEGVAPVEGRPDLSDWFNRFATGGAKDLSSNYKSLAEGCGMQFQLDYFQGLTKDFNVHPDRHFTADVSYLELKNEYDRLMREDAAFARDMGGAVSPGPADPGKGDALVKGFLDYWQSGTPEQKKILGFVCRGFFAWSFAQKKPTTQKDKVILDYRNTRLARMIADAKEDKIWITYGADHIPGVIRDLQKIDPSWRVVATKWARVMANPEDWNGELR